MFEINVDLSRHIPPRAAYSRMTIDEIYGHVSWDADLNITNNDQIFFSEEIAIIEFYWYLTDWYRRYHTGNNVPFVYTSVEHTSPILVFLYQNGGIWEIDSPWRQCNTAILIEEQVFHTEIRNLVARLSFALEG